MTRFKIPTLRYVALMFGLVAWTLAYAQDATMQVRVLSTTDIHTAVMDYDYYRDQADNSQGLARAATLIRQARSEMPNVLLFDSGDLLQGNPLGDFIAVEQRLQPGQVHPVIRAMNLLGYAAATLGNHEFNYGLDFLRLSLAGANYPYATANVFLENPNRAAAQPFIQPFVMFEREFVDSTGARRRLRVGAIGFVPPQIMQWDRAHLEGRVFTIDIVEAARRYVPQMRASGANLVIAMAHTGLSAGPARGMDENAAAYLTSVEGIDAVLSGHAHLVFPDQSLASIPGADIARGTINGVPVVMPGFWGSHIGVVDLTLQRNGEGWRRVAGTASTRAIRRREGNQWVAAVEPDPEIVAAIRAEHDGTLAYVRRPVARSTARIHSYFSLVQDDPSIQLVARAQADYVRRQMQNTPHASLPVLSASAPFKSGGRGGPNYYTDVPQGDIAIRNVADLYLYPNTVRAVRVSGAILREWLEMSAGQFNRIDPAVTTPQQLINNAFPTFNFDVIDGVTYRIDVTQPARYTPQGRPAEGGGRRIADLQYQGRPVTDDMQFIVATNNYRASGGGNFPGMDGSNIVLEAGETNQEIIKDWLIEQRTVDAAVTPNWSFAPIAAPVRVVFESSPNARSLVAGHPRIREAGDAANGFALFAIDMR